MFDSGCSAPVDIMSLASDMTLEQLLAMVGSMPAPFDPAHQTHHLPLHDHCNVDLVSFMTELPQLTTSAPDLHSYDALLDAYPTSEAQGLNSLPLPVSGPLAACRSESPYYESMISPSATSGSPPHTPGFVPLSAVAPTHPQPFYYDTFRRHSLTMQLPSSNALAASPLSCPIALEATHFPTTASPIPSSPLAIKNESPSPISPASARLSPPSLSSLDATLPRLTLPSPSASPPGRVHVKGVQTKARSYSESSNGSTFSSKPTRRGVGGSKHKRHTLDVEQAERLNQCFAESRFLKPNQAVELSAELRMTPTQIKIWFQNKRAYGKRKGYRRGSRKTKISAGEAAEEDEGDEDDGEADSFAVLEDWE
ncbi:hypothetical protein BC830DRAFT_1084731 [Chytriomyces sp. MP71]|nr:hypothetical protein BC830DRAFT_1084731 [Chytriomyces sp. MP71]